MEKIQYDNKVKYIKKLIAANKITEAEKEIERMKNLRPWSLPYICAQVQVMLRQGKDKRDCKDILDNICQEKYIGDKYVCDELAEIFELKKQLFSTDDIEWKLCDFSAKLYAGKKKECLYIDKLKETKKIFLQADDAGRGEKLKELAEAYYIVRNMNMYFVLMMAWCCKRNKQAEYEEYIHEEAGQTHYGTHSRNLGYLAKLLQDEKSYEFLLVESLESDNDDIAILSWGLQAMGNKTIGIGQPVASEGIAGNKVQASILNAVASGNTIDIHPVLDDITDKQEYVRVTASIIQFFADNLEQEVALTVFSQDAMMDELQGAKQYAKHFQRLSEKRPQQFSHTMAFAWAGDYCKYMSYIYGFSVRERIDRAAECAVSIVIPVRNSADTLRYTLQTCLNQKCKADYEIVLSDNSDEGNHAVYDLYRELNDSRIHYYHTPFVLDLTKSFEFAFLQARGEFIFSIGADDGVFPWTVQRIVMALPHMTESDILQWNRAFYGWPSFNPLQRNTLSFTLVENKLPMAISIRSLSDDFLQYIQNTRAVLYGIPFFYINSGFRRRYFHKLLRETGRLWDGASQDLQAGAINLAINPFEYCISEPLSIAGMSSHSIGASSSKANNDFSQLLSTVHSLHKNFTEQLGEYIQLPTERLLPSLGGIGHDVRWFYKAIFRLSDMNIVGNELTNHLNISDIVLTAFKWNQNTDVWFYLNLYEILACAEEAGKEACAEHIKNERINIHIDEQKCEDSEERISAKLKMGYTDCNKNLNLNVSSFGAYNVAEAAKIVEKINDLSIK